MMSDVSAGIRDQDISDAYIYFLARLLCLNVELQDLSKDFTFNTILHRAVGKVDFPNPNLDVAYSEAWMALDEMTPVIVEIPKITGRYYTFEVLNGWGEVLANINDHALPAKPYGTFAFCLKGSSCSLPPGAFRIDLPTKQSRVLARVELGADPAGAIKLQHQITIQSAGNPKITPPIKINTFSNAKLPSVEAFEKAGDILGTDPDINPGMAALQAKVRATEELIESGAEGRSRVAQVIHEQALPRFQKLSVGFGVAKNGWRRAEKIGNYGDDYETRTVIDYGGIWANVPSEAIYFVGFAPDGSQLTGANSYTMTFPKDELPKDHVRYFWSIVCLDDVNFKVIENPLSRYILNNQSNLTYNADGSLTIALAPTLPVGIPESNWLPTPADKEFSLTFRFYGPMADVMNGIVFPPTATKI
jgi:hypothetical protein